MILQAVGAHRGSENVEFDEKIREFNLHVNEIQRIRYLFNLKIIQSLNHSLILTLGKQCIFGAMRLTHSVLLMSF